METARTAPTRKASIPRFLLAVAMATATSLATALVVSSMQSTDAASFMRQLQGWWPGLFAACLIPSWFLAFIVNGRNPQPASDRGDSRGVAIAEQTGVAIALVTAIALTLSIGEIIFAVAFYLSSPTAERTMEAIGAYLGGAAGTLGFVWIIAGFWVQSRELLLQRHELSLQRQAIERSAAAAQMEIALALRGAYVRRLGETAGHIARLLYEPEAIVDVELASSQGNTEAFIHWLLRTPDMEARLRHNVQSEDLITASFVEQYISYDREFISLVESTEHENRLISETLRVDHPSKLARAFRSVIGKTASTPRESVS